MFKKLTDYLDSSFDDIKIDNTEKVEARLLFAPLDDEQRAFVRNRAFDMVREQANFSDDHRLLKWLEGVIRLLDQTQPETAICDTYFSPGSECRDCILQQIRGARSGLDICVFTISDNAIRDAILQADRRGVHVRVITDNDKTFDKGNDVHYLSQQGIAVRIDNSRHHMHHKFAIIDSKQVITGSFNWTRSATEYNQENIILIDSQKVTQRFQREFEQLWQTFS